jgi:hypothetical protein
VYEAAWVAVQVAVLVPVLAQVALHQAWTKAQAAWMRVAVGYLQAAQQVDSQVLLAQVQGCHALID